jgi:hypothetical protein
MNVLDGQFIKKAANSCSWYYPTHAATRGMRASEKKPPLLAGALFIPFTTRRTES